MIRQQLFTLITLLGCIAPWVTPRHFPIHKMQGAREPVVLPWVIQGADRMQVSQPAQVEEVGQRQLAGELATHRMK
jgi:hypothetical protein